MYYQLCKCLNYQRQALEQRLDGQLLKEFETVPRKSTRNDCIIALEDGNRPRNRFKDVQPYDVNRVKLTPTKDNPSGYVNASHIKVSLGCCHGYYNAKC